MFLNNLQLRNFRNYGELQLEFSPQLNFFYGENGAGKTNILEAIQLVLLGDSFRTGSLQSILPKNGTPECQIKSLVTTPHTKNQLQFSYRDGKRSLLRDEKREGQKARLTDFATVVFSPESLGAVKDEPGVRRKMLDRIACGIFPKEIEVFIEAQKVLRMRNALLHQISEAGPSAVSLFDHLDSLNEVYLRTVSRMVSCRLKALKKVHEKFVSISKNILQLQDVEIYVDYVISEQSAIDWSPDKVYDSLLQRMHELDKVEKAAGRSLVGPHKHDVRFIFNGEDARTYCSQGQQRVLALALKIAQIESHYEVHKHYPVLLLDDVMSELDEERRATLVSLLQNMQAQIFMTTTDRQPHFHLENKQVELFRVNKGSVAREG